MMRTVETDPSGWTKADHSAVHRVGAECHEAAMAGEPYRTLQDTTGFVLHPPASETRRYWLSRSDGGEIVGVGLLAYSAGGTVAHADVTVLPEHRHSGHGHSLLDALAATARRDTDATSLLLRAIDDGGSSFSSGAGGAQLRIDYRQLLDLRSQLPQIAALKETAPAHPGYELVAWERTPDDLLESYALARGAIDDAPHAEGDEWVWTPDVVRDLEAATRARRRSVHVHAVLDRTRRVVAFTELRVSSHTGAVAATEDTAVSADHRRKGLATWMKATSLTDLASARPDVRFVTTTNASTNVPVLALNDRLGFEKVGSITEFRLDLGTQLKQPE